MSLARWLGLGLLVVALAGCGFHLRGGEATSAWRLQLEGPLEPALRRMLDDLSAASGRPARLEFQRPRWQQRVLTVGTDGKALEYELRLYLRYRLTDPQGVELLPWQALDLRRDYAFDPAQVLAKSREAELLRQDLRREAVRRIDRRLRQLAQGEGA